MPLLLLGAGRSRRTISIATNWNPGNSGLTYGWYDMTNPASYNGTSWTRKYGTAPIMVKQIDGPAVVTDGIDGATNALRFDGAFNTHLYMQSPGINEFVTCVVMDFSVRSTDVPIVARPDHTNTRVIAFAGGGIRAEYLGGEADDYAVDTNNPSIIVTRHSKNQRVVRHNGVEVAVSNIITSGTENSADPIYLGFYDSTIRTWTMRVSAFGVFYNSFINNGSYTTSFAERLEGYCAHHGSLGVSTAQLPIGHPYKTTPPTV